MTYRRNQLDDLLWQEEQEPVYLNQGCCVPPLDWALEENNNKKKKTTN